ncbi:MAG: outer membrane protein assembly factor BamE [Alphaproteobacteria bacterium]|nr:outer membrane protein assembly factor BamE [Alphaproteobacteria bacterium]
MSIRNLFFLLSFIFCTACSTDIFSDYNGNIPEESKIEQIKVGQTRQEVYNILGAPSITTALSDDHWIYMSSTIRRVAFLNPHEIDRQILALTFKDDKVSKIERKTLADANNISINGDETKPAERKIGFFRKYFGGVGTYMPFGGKKEDEGL